MSAASHAVPIPWRVPTAALGLWLGAILLLGVAGVLTGPFLPLFTFGPLGLAALGWVASARVRRWVDRLDLPTLVALHATRTVGLGFLFLAAYGVLPGVFAWPAGLGDAITAVGAVGLVIWWMRRGPVSKRVLVWWNTFGLVDFLVAVAVGTLARSALLGGAANTDAMAALPLVLFPAFVVPFFALTHLAVFAKLRRVGPAVR